MEESDESTDYSAIFDDDILLQQTYWDHLLRNKMKIDKWKELNHNNIKIHVNKEKDEMLDHLEKETYTDKLMMDKSLGSDNNITLEEVSELCLGRNGVLHGSNPYAALTNEVLEI